MKKFVYTACILAGAPLIAAPAPENRFIDFEKMNQFDRSLEDHIILRDGTQINGSITSIPALNYVFGSLPLKINQVAAIAFSKNQIKVLTHEGLTYVGSMPHENFVILQYLPSRQHPKYTIQKEIDPDTISYLVFRDRGVRSSLNDKPLFEVELKTGDRLPISLTGDLVKFSTGLNDVTLNLEQVINLSVDAGIYGTYKTEQGRTENFDFAFAKEKILQVHLAGHEESLGLPWNQISKIYRIDPTPVQYKEVVIESAPEDNNTQIELATLLELEQTRSQVLRDSLKELHQKWEALNDTHQKGENQIDQFTKRLEELETINASIEKEAQTQLADLASLLEAERVASQSEKAELQNKIVSEWVSAIELERALSASLQDQVSLYPIQIEKLQEEIMHLNNSIQEEKTHSASLQKLIFDSHEKFVTTDDSVKTLEENFHHAHHLLLRENERYQQVQKELEEVLAVKKADDEGLKLELLNHINEINEHLVEKQHLIEELQHAKAIDQEAHHKVERLTENLNDEKAHSEKLAKLIDETSEHNHRFQQEIDILKGQLAYQHEVAEKASEVMGGLSLKWETEQQRAQELEEKITALKMALDLKDVQLQANQEAHSHQLEILAKGFEKERSDTLAYQTELQQLRDYKQTLEAQLEAVNNFSEELAVKIDSLMAELTRERNKKALSPSDLEDKITAYEAELAALNKAFKTMETEITLKYEQEKGEMIAALEFAKNEKEDIALVVRNEQERNEGLGTQLEHALLLLSDNQYHLTKTEGKVYKTEVANEQLQSKIDVLEKNIAAKDELIERLNRSLSAQQSAIDRIEESHRALRK